MLLWPTVRNFLCVACASTMVLAATKRAEAGCALTDWLFGYGETAYTPAYPGTPMCGQAGACGCAPAACGCAPACAPTCGCQMPVVQQTTSYRPFTRPVPVVAYMPITGVNPATGCAVTTYQPTQAWSYQAALVPYTNYRASYAPVTVSAAYLPVTSGCSTCNAPVYNTAAYGGCSTCSANYATPTLTNYAPASYAPATTGCSSCGMSAATTYSAPLMPNSVATGAPQLSPSQYGASTTYGPTTTSGAALPPPLPTPPTVVAPPVGGQQTFGNPNVPSYPPSIAPSGDSTTSADRSPATLPTRPVDIRTSVPSQKFEGVPPVEEKPQSFPVSREGESKVTARPVYQAGYFQPVPAAIPGAAVDNQWRHFEP